MLLNHEDQSSDPSTGLGGSQTPVSPAPGDMAPCSSLCWPETELLSWVSLVSLVWFWFVLWLLFLIGSHVAEVVCQLDTTQRGLALNDPPASTSQVLGLQAHTPRPCVCTCGSVSSCRTQRAGSVLSAVLCLACMYQGTQ